MRKLLLVLALFLAAAAGLQTSAIGQTLTTVAGTITDPNGLPYSGARLSPLLVSPGGQSPSLTPCSSPVGCQIQNPGAVTLDSTGSFTINLWANASILPAGTTYSFAVNEPGVPPPFGTGPQVYTVTGVTIAGATQSLTTTLTTPAPALTLIGTASSPGKAAPNQGAVYLSANCSTGQVNCIPTFADTEVISDATFTSGSAIITSTSSDPPFTSADVGKRAQATYGCSNPASNPEKCSGSACPETTIKTFTDAHHVVLTANCTQNSTGAGTNNKFAWGHADDTGIANAVAAITARTFGTIYLPCTGMWVEQAAFQLVLPNPGFAGRGPMSVIGCPSGSAIVPGFNFSYAGCPANGGCIFHDNNVADNAQFNWSGGNDTFRDVDIQGLGIDCAACTFTNPIAAVDIAGLQSIDNVHINGWNWNAPSNFDAALCTGGTIKHGFINAGGRNAVRVPSGAGNGCNIVAYTFLNNGNGAALRMEGGNAVYSDDSQYFADSSDSCVGPTNGVIQTAGVIYSTHDAHTEFCVEGGKAWITDSIFFGGGGFLDVTASGAIAHLKGILFEGGAFSTIFSAAGSNVYDDGGNTITAALPTISGNLFNSLSITGTPATAGNFAASGGWGASAAFTAVSGEAHTAEFTLTNTGAGQAANPTVTYTFPNDPGATFSYWATPSCTAQQIGGTQGIQDFTRTAASKTAVTFQWNGTPTVNLTEIVRVSCQ